MLLRALGYSSNSDICKAGNLINIDVSKEIEKYIGATITEDVIDTKTGEYLEGVLSSQLRLLKI